MHFLLGKYYIGNFEIKILPGIPPKRAVNFSATFNETLSSLLGEGTASIPILLLHNGIKSQTLLPTFLLLFSQIIIFSSSCFDFAYKCFANDHILIDAT